MGNPSKNELIFPLENKKVVFGITGGIAAYKAPLIARILRSHGAEVYTVMTQSSLNFVTPYTMQVLTSRPVYTKMFENAPSKIPFEIDHVSLADKADILLIAPATANILAKMAHGIADDLLSTTILATWAPVLVCPSMNVNMFENKATQENLSILRSRGIYVLEPDSGQLACGWEGKGRMPEPERIVAEIEKILSPNDFSELNILITAGPTCEDIDPVRYITNRSTGKMGASLVDAACLRGAQVKVISGPVQVAYAPWAEVIQVRSAEEMFNAVKKNLKTTDILIMAAAVADYVPASYTDKKIKKRGGLSLSLKASIDILSTITKYKGKKIFVGFAAETDNIKQYGAQKLKAKGLDLIIANEVGKDGTGFESDTNTGIIISSAGIVEKFEAMQKKALAHVILNHIKETMS